MEKCGITEKWQEGVLQVIPVEEGIIRVIRSPWPDPRPDELVLQPQPDFDGWKRGSGRVLLETDALRVSAGETGLVFEDREGRELLRELAADFGPDPEEWMEQRFFSPEGEVLGGLGQQADGAADYRGRFAHLCQFNTISAVPVLMSSRGYGILWNNCSLTELNPHKTPLSLRWDVYSKTSHGSYTPEETGQYIFILEKRNKNIGFEELNLRVGEQTIIRQGSNWHPNYFTGAVWLEADRSYETWLDGDANLYVQQPSQASVTSFWSEMGSCIDYFFLYGPRKNNVIRRYRRLTGEVPLFPKWAYGYWQSKECYRSGQELLDIVAEHRRRGHPMDAIVQDWMYWGDYGWNAMRFAPSYAADMPEVIRQLHENNVHLMVSVWPNFSEGSAPEDPAGSVWEEFSRKGYLMDDHVLPGMEDYTSALQGFRRNYYDVWNPDAREAFWRWMDRGLFQAGVDAWWLDGTEPNLWSLQGAYHHYRTCDGPAARRLNAYTFQHSRSIYQNQRAASGEKRVFMLSRTGFTGIQSTGTAVWSGDTWGSWEVLERQIQAGVQYSLSGLPYWTSDIGGFMGISCEEPAYRELYLRWFQFVTFCPIFRAHGTRIPREVWQFGPEVEEILHRYLTLRYRLMPYLYSLAWRVTRYGDTMMRSLMMDFPEDARALAVTDQYLFGPALMVCPVTKPGATTRKVWLPAGCGWYDFWTGRWFAGGQELEAAAPMEQLPLFVRAGSILPMGPEITHAAQPVEELELRIYTGQDGEYLLYEDSGDGYDYEKGVYAQLPLRWRDAEQTLELGPKAGSFPFSWKLRLTLVTPEGERQGPLICCDGAEAMQVRLAAGEKE